MKYEKDEQINRVRTMYGMAPIVRTPNPQMDRLNARLGRDVSAGVDPTDLSRAIGAAVAGRAQTSQIDPFQRFATVKALTAPTMSGPAGQIANVTLIGTSYEYPGKRRPVPATPLEFGDPAVHLGHSPSLAEPPTRR
jgi:hypothetical protein